METKWQERAGAKLRYQTGGVGKPPILFVHGLTCCLEDWEHQINHFSPSHRVSTCDLRGHGQSETGDASISIESFGADVAALLDELDFTDAILVGHSMGTRVVMEAARLAPNRVAKLVLVDGSRIGTGDPDEMEARMRGLIGDGGYAPYHKNMFAMMFTPDSDPALRDTVLQRCAATPTENGLAAFINLVRWDAAKIDATLAGLNTPILVIQSTKQDENRVRVPLKEGEVTEYMTFVAETAADATTVSIADIGHFTMLERPGQVNKLIDCFIAGSPLP